MDLNEVSHTSLAGPGPGSWVVDREGNVRISTAAAPIVRSLGSAAGPEAGVRGGGGEGSVSSIGLGLWDTANAHPLEQRLKWRLGRSRQKKPVNIISSLRYFSSVGFAKQQPP